jgi:AraC-like DNA-binding protein
MKNIRRIWHDYKGEFIFAVVLIVGVLISYRLAPLIPVSFYDQSLSPILNGSIAVTCIYGAILLFRHHEGVHVRILWACVLLVWAALVTIFLLVNVYNIPLDSEDTISLRDEELIIGNFYAWLLLHYPTAVLRPGYLNPWRALLSLLPVVAIAVADYLIPYDLRLLLAIYPVILSVLLMVYHVRAYRKWCEENFSSMERIDVQWIYRYMTMYILLGFTYVHMCFHYDSAHVFTEQWLLLFVLGYSTEQILYRQDPWNMIRHAVKTKSWSSEIEVEEPEEGSPELTNAEYRATLEQWMDSEKPYRNPDFRLLDLKQVLPINRTYLSQFINSEYGCNFYQFVTNYRIEDAKRMMAEHPDWKLQDIAEKCGFSSPVVFSRIFTRETGITPHEWNTKIDNS